MQGQREVAGTKLKQTVKMETIDLTLRADLAEDLARLQKIRKELASLKATSPKPIIDEIDMSIEDIKIALEIFKQAVS